MIIDTLDNLMKYESLNPLFKDVVEFIKNNDLGKLDEGTYSIKGNDLFVNITSTDSRKANEAVLETHVKMIDIQIPLDAEETYGYAPLLHLPDTPYDEQRDLTIYESRAESFVTCAPGMFAIFFPQDGHAPCISNSTRFRKAIFKVKA